MSKDLLFTEVATFMVFHVPLGTKALAAALGAVKGAVIAMDSGVSQQVLLLLKSLFAARKAALVGLGTLM